MTAAAARQPRSKMLKHRNNCGGHCCTSIDHDNHNADYDNEAYDDVSNYYYYSCCYYYYCCCCCYCYC